MPLTRIVIMLFMTAATLSMAQDPDTLNVPPGIVRIKAEILSAEKNTAVIKVLEVVGYGSGIVNLLSAGQELTISLRDETVKVKSHQRLQADLREKMGADAALSTYTLLTAKKLER